MMKRFIVVGDESQVLAVPRGLLYPMPTERDIPLAKAVRGRSQRWRALLCGPIDLLCAMPSLATTVYARIQNVGHHPATSHDR
jgi:hypothetical protein